MRSSKWFSVAVLSSLAGVANAAHVDFNDPKRALGREDDVRIDASLSDDTLSSTAAVSVTYQIENLSKSTVAVADKIAESDYDAESGTITLSIGAEIPKGANLPHMVTIKPGEKRTLTSGIITHIAVPSVRTPWSTYPRYVAIKVTVLRDVNSFASLIDKQNASSTPVALPNDLFDRWIEGSGSIYLNAIPIYWKNDPRTAGAESDRPAAGGRV